MKLPASRETTRISDDERTGQVFGLEDVAAEGLSQPAELPATTMEKYQICVAERPGQSQQRMAMRKRAATSCHSD